MKKHRQLLRMLLCAFVFMMLSLQVKAAGKIDLDCETSLTIHAEYSGMPIKNMVYRAYFVSSVKETGELLVEDQFAAFADELDIRGKNDSAWYQMAIKLEREIMRNPDISEEMCITTDDQGIGTVNHVKRGLFLIMADGVEQNEFVYTTVPFFVSIPTEDVDTNTWNYHVSAKVKLMENPQKADYKVVKIWKDECHKEQRPEKIRIQLLCDGENYDVITLPYNGHWEYTWKSLDVNHKWTVVEEQQKGYKSPEITQEGTTFFVTNSCNKVENSKPPMLPQTGQLWWPVPILIFVGLVFILIGLVKRRRNDDEA